MGFFDLLSFGKRDPTRNWVGVPGLVIDFDFSSHALCGVKIGDPAEWLAKLGPAEDKRAAGHGQYCYYSKGLEVRVKKDLVTSYLLVWDDYLRQGHRPFSGVCKHRGRNLMLNGGTSEGDIVRHFGDPYWRDEDQEEIILFYECIPVEWQVELSLEGRLKAMNIVTPPSLADEEQRRLYTVTKPWPPR